MSQFQNILASFRFVWPLALLLLMLLPLWWWLYARQLRQRLQSQALSFSYAAVAAQLKNRPSGWKRLLYPVTVCGVMACLIIALARPMVSMPISVQSADVMLVLDISLSMMADDLKPTRLEAAKRAAADFVRRLPENMRVGLTVFAGDVYVLAPPTRKHNEVIADLEALREEDLKPRTEIGSALHSALQALGRQSRLTQSGSSSKSKLKDALKGNSPSASEKDSNKFNEADSNAEVSPETEKPSTSKTGNSQAGQSPINKHQDQAIVLLSDGDSHEGYPWDRAAKDAAKAGITIDAIGIGSALGGVIHYHGVELPISFDERTLRRIAELAHGQYFRAFQASDFKAAYQQIQARTVHTEELDIDLGFALAVLALLSILSASALATRWGL
jgi:Ca-activated chloride channel family protein